MLVLSRRLGEEIVIAEAIRIAVVSLTGGQVRLGITAPKSVPIRRQEVGDRSPRPEVEGGAQEPAAARL